MLCYTRASDWLIHKIPFQVYPIGQLVSLIEDKSKLFDELLDCGKLVILLFINVELILFDPKKVVLLLNYSESCGTDT